MIVSYNLINVRMDMELCLERCHLTTPSVLDHVHAGSVSDEFGCLLFSP